MLEMWWEKHVGDVVEEVCWRCGGRSMLEMWWEKHVGDVVGDACWRCGGKSMLEMSVILRKIATLAACSIL
jgi:hypothetical protein